MMFSKDVMSALSVLQSDLLVIMLNSYHHICYIRVFIMGSGNATVTVRQDLHNL